MLLLDIDTSSEHSLPSPTSSAQARKLSTFTSELDYLEWELEAVIISITVTMVLPFEEEK